MQTKNAIGQIGQTIEFETSPAFLDALTAALRLHVQRLRSVPDSFVRADVCAGAKPRTVSMTLVWACEQAASRCHEAGLLELPSFIELSRLYHVRSIIFRNI